MDAYRLEHWHDFLVAQAAAGAALTGLVFVAISINLNRIVDHPVLVGRAAEALILLLALLVVALAALIPGQENLGLGIELLAAGGVFWIAVFWNLPKSAESIAMGATAFNHAVRMTLTHLATLPIILCGASLAAGIGGGLYWLPVSTLFCLTAGVVGAWVLLVEILR